MLRFSNLRRILLVSSLCLWSFYAHADSTGPSYDINGTLSITGVGNACAGTQCIETLTYSFLLDYSLVPDDQARLISSTASGEIYLGQVAGPVLVSSSGPMGLFDSYGSLFEDRGAYYLPFFDTVLPNTGDEIDLFMGFVETDPAFGVPAPSAMFSALYSCRSTDCADDFNNGVSDYGYVIPESSAQFTALPVAVPEPSTIELILIAMLFLIVKVTSERTRMVRCESRSRPASTRLNTTTKAL